MPLTFPTAIAQIRKHAAQGELSFIATAATHWHALGVDAFVAARRERGDSGGGVVLLMSHPANGMLLSEKDFPLCAAEANVLLLPVHSRLPSRFAPTVWQCAKLAARALALLLSEDRSGVSAEHTLRIASPRLPDIFTLLHLPRRLLQERSVDLVVLDEGLSSYLPAAVAGQVRRGDRVVSRTGTVIREFELMLRRLYDRAHGLISSRYPHSHRLLFHPNDAGQLVVDAKIATAYRAAAASHPLSCKLHQPGDEPLAVILPQPWSEIGETNAQAEVALFGEVARDLAAQGFRVAIKPHPREAAGKYSALAAQQVELLTQAVPVETLFSQLSSRDLVLGHNTTSLLTAAALSPARAATLGRMLQERDAAGPVFRTFQAHFQRLAGDSVVDASELLARRNAA